MQALKIIQAFILLIIVALAASCSAGKEYAGKLFFIRPQATADTQKIAVKFLESDSFEINKDNWIQVGTAIPKDTISETASSYKPGKTAPGIDTAGHPSREEKKTLPAVENSSAGKVRNKRTRE